MKLYIHIKVITGLCVALNFPPIFIGKVNVIKYRKDKDLILLFHTQLFIELTYSR